MNDSTEEVMLICMRVPSITFVKPIVPEKLT